MSIIYPPRPKGKITPGDLPRYERMGKWVVQRKFNGTRNLVHISSDRKVNLYSRHGEKHKTFQPTTAVLEELLSLNLETGKEYWLDSELLHAKTSSADYKSRIILFDVLQAGRYFFGRPNQMERLKILGQICKSPTEHEPFNGLALQVSPHIWMAETFASGFADRFQDHIETDEIEGLVLRKKESSLKNYGSSPYEVTWLLRCRKPHQGGSYNF